MNILSIGNSFSQDAQRYVHEIAKADGVKLDTYNLYIGGCPLFVHYRNMISDEKAYVLEVNGVSTGFKVSLKEALLNKKWDVITIQQASHESVNYGNYQPYLDKLAEYVRYCSPHAKVAVHQTWAYEQDSKRLTDELGYKNHTDMFYDIKDAYEKASESIKADFVIPSGELLQNLIKAGFERVHRDKYHTSLGVGRYAIGLLWYQMLTGNSVENNNFIDFDEEVTEKEIEIIKKTVSETYKLYRK